MSKKTKRPGSAARNHGRRTRRSRHFPRVARQAVQGVMMVKDLIDLAEWLWHLLRLSW